MASPFILRTSCETFQETTALLNTGGIRTRLVYRTDQDDRALGLVTAGVGVAPTAGAVQSCWSRQRPLFLILELKGRLHPVDASD
jgi:hypothetical protein